MQPQLHPYLFIIFFATLFEYNLHRLITVVTNPEALNSEKHKWVKQHLNHFHDGIPLPMSPVQQIVSVTYIDGDNVVQTVDPATYTLDDWSAMNVLNLASGISAWPVAQQVPAAVKIRYIAGYSLPSDSPDVWPLPKLIRAAMLLAVGHFYENREASTDLKMEELPLGIGSLLERYRLRLSLA